MATTYTQTYEISLEPGKVPKPVVNLTQGDYATRVLAFHLLEDLEEDTSLRSTYYYLQGKKSNGLGFKLGGRRDKTTNIITFTTNKEMTECGGMIDAEISIIGMSQMGDKVRKIGTAGILLNIKPTAHPDGTKDSTKDEIIDEIGRLANVASAAADNAKTSETNAKQSETNAKTSETNAATSATTASEKAQQIADYYSQMVTEKLTNFITIESEQGLPVIKWQNSNVYRTGDRIHGILEIDNAVTPLTVTYSSEEYKPTAASYGTTYGEDGTTAGGYVLTAETLKITNIANVLFLSLDYTIKTANTYEDGDNLTY